MNGVNVPQGYVSVRAFADLLEVRQDEIGQLIAAGELRAHHFDGTTVLLATEALYWLARRLHKVLANGGLR